MLARLLNRVWRREDGVALVVALGALAVIAILTATVAAASMQLSDSSNSDRHSKRSFAATEAALEVATYRLNNLALTDTDCRTDPTQPAGTCSASGDLGNGTKWSYHMSSAWPGGKCAGFSAEYDANSTVAPRCVTATATAGRVARRVQARLSAFRGVPIFPAHGILGINGVELKNTATINGYLGSNGLISLQNSSRVTNGLVLGPAAPQPQVGNSYVGEVIRRTPEQGPWVLAPVEIGNSATVNNNGAWTFSGKSNDMSWNESGPRELKLQGGKLTLHGGIYNFCDVEIKNNATIVLASGVPGQPPPRAIVFIDSPERGAASGCRPGTGRLVANNSFDNPGPAENLQVYVYGADPAPGTPAVEFLNSVNMTMALHAPRATVSFKNDATFRGAVNANKAVFHNGVEFTFGGNGVAGLRTLKTSPLWERTAWRECQSKPTTDDPASGC